MHGEVVHVLQQIHEARVRPLDKTLTSLKEREILHDLAELGDDLAHGGPFLGRVLDHARDQRIHEREVRVRLQPKIISASRK